MFLGLCLCRVIFDLFVFVGVDEEGTKTKKKNGRKGKGDR